LPEAGTGQVGIAAAIRPAHSSGALLVTAAFHPADALQSRHAMLELDPLHLEVIQLATSAAARLGMPTARRAAAARHELWTAALLVHEVAANPLWRAGSKRPERTVGTVLAAARRLTDAALRVATPTAAQG
jgi:hypothetical protein